MKPFNEFRDVIETKNPKPIRSTSASWAVEIDMLATKVKKSKDTKEQLTLISEQNRYLGYIMDVYAPD